MNILSVIIFCSIAYALFSILLIIFMRKIRYVWLKSSLITLYFCVTIFTLILYSGMRYSFYAGESCENLRRSSVATAESVRILYLLHKSNAKEIAPGHYGWVAHNLENEIDSLLPVANDYLANKDSIRWRLVQKWGIGNMEGICFPRDLPSVVEYRKNNPPVYDHGKYDLVLSKYEKKTYLSSLKPDFK